MSRRLLLAFFGVMILSGIYSIPVSASGGTLYTVQPGDTFYSIAADHGLSLDELLTANQLTWNSWVSAGQQLIIPRQEISTPSPPLDIVPQQPITIEPTFSESTPVDRTNANIVDQPITQYLFTPSQNQDSASPSSNGERWIDIDLTNQRLTAYEGNIPVFTAIVSTGTWRTPTIVGTFNIYVKYEKARMSGGSGADAYDLPDVPYVMYFHKGYGLHGTYWHNNFGTQMSHGCVNLSIEDSEWLFNWASVGTKVVTHY